MKEVQISIYYEFVEIPLKISGKMIEGLPFILQNIFVSLSHP